MVKTKKPRRPTPRTPKGFRDYFGAEVAERKAMLDAIAEVYHRYGFDALESSAVETVEALGKFLPDVDRPNEGVFAWQEPGQGDAPDGDWLALRYDLTAPLARVYAEHRNELPTPYRRYAMGPVWRNEKPGPGRFRQFYQCDADTVGSGSVAADAEMCAMLCDALEAAGIKRGEYVVRVNNRKVLDGVMEAAGIAENDVHTRGIVLRAIDKLDRLGTKGVIDLFRQGRKDESGDFSEGANLSVQQANRILQFFMARNNVFRNASLYADNIENPIERDKELRGVAYVNSDAPYSREAVLAYNKYLLRSLKGLVSGIEVGFEGVSELEQIASLLDAEGYGPDRIIIDPSIVRGLGYYTGPVFEAELTFEITDEKGQTRNFGSVAGGGRYDDLVTRFTGQQVPATGVSIGVDRLLAALQAKGRAAKADPGPVIVTVMDRDRMADYQAICATLRGAGIRAEVYLGNPKNFGNQLKYADKRNSPAAIIQGSDEAARGVVQVKDLILGAKLAEDASVEEWKENPSQTEVPLDGLVDHLASMGLGPTRTE